MNQRCECRQVVPLTRLGRLSWVRIAVPLMFVLTGVFVVRLQVTSRSLGPAGTESHAVAQQHGGRTLHPPPRRSSKVSEPAKLATDASGMAAQTMADEQLGR